MSEYVKIAKRIEMDKMLVMTMVGLEKDDKVKNRLRKFLKRLDDCLDLRLAFCKLREAEIMKEFEAEFL